MTLHARCLVSFVAALVALGCSEEPPATLPAPTHVQVALAAGAKLGGVALGDIHPELPGLEIVAVAVDGRVIVVRRVRGRWRSEVAFQAPGELIQVACGDLLPAHPGDEILAVGMASGDEEAGGPGAVWLGSRNRGVGFEGRKLFETSALQHAAAIGDFDPTRPGLEGLSAGFDERVHLVNISEDFVATERVVAELPGPGKGACVWGRSAFVACASGQVVEIASDAGGTFGATVVLEYEAGLARPAVNADRLVVAADDGALLLGGLGGSSPVRVLHRQTAKARGAAIGEFDSSSPGLEAATLGYEGRVLVLRLGTEGADGLPEVVELTATSMALHHLVAGDVLPDVPGDELVAVGYGGEILVFSH